jgi:hypothetical protein
LRYWPSSSHGTHLKEQFFDDGLGLQFSAYNASNATNFQSASPETRHRIAIHELRAHTPTTSRIREVTTPGDVSNAEISVVVLRTEFALMGIVFMEIAPLAAMPPDERKGFAFP